MQQRTLWIYRVVYYCYLEVVELGSFVKVAEQRNVDRSVISKQISRLEEDLDVRLLNRTTRSLSLTAAGNEMVNQAHQLRALLNDTDAWRKLSCRASRIIKNHQLDHVRSTICSAGDCGFSRSSIQMLILELRLEDRIVDMVKEGFDIGFRIGKPKNSSLISQAR